MCIQCAEVFTRHSTMSGIGETSRIGARFRLARGVAAAAVVGSCLAGARSADAALESGVYHTVPGATVEERGDRVPNGSRVVPFSATLTFDLGDVQPSLAAVIPNAVLEGGDPFALTVRSSSGVRLTDGTYRFEGDYLRELYPAGTQYLFDWRFSTAAAGGVAWNGSMGWAGGHIWQVTISSVTLVPEPGTLALIWAGLAGLLALRAWSRADP